MGSGNEVEVELTLIDEGGRRIDTAPADIGIGALRLRNWQVHPISTPQDMFDNMDGYLVKINYELRLEPGSPMMTWFEIGFGFGDEESDPVMVLDALPHTTPAPQGATSYVLNQYLNLVPHGDGSLTHAHLPATTSTVDVFGIGGQEARWRHSSDSRNGVRPGSHVAWVVLMVPAGITEQRVEVSARYDLRTGGDVDYLPTQRPSVFRLRLVDLPIDCTVFEPSLSTEAARTVVEHRPRVFISYAHEDPEHKAQAHHFGDLLLRCGIDAHMDQWEAPKRKDWHLWAIRQIKAADFVLILASPTCKAVGDGAGEPNRNRGMESETAILRELLQQDREQWGPKLLPVVLPGESVENLPLYLQPRTMDHYEVEELTEEGIEDLLRALTERRASSDRRSGCRWPEPPTP